MLLMSESLFQRRCGRLVGIDVQEPRGKPPLGRGRRGTTDGGAGGRRDDGRVRVPRLQLQKRQQRDVPRSHRGSPGAEDV